MPGATVPGGAPAKYTLNINKPAVDPTLGSTLPGAPATVAVIKNDTIVPYDDEERSPSPVEQETHVKTHNDKPPVPAPRLSIHATDCPSTPPSISPTQTCDDSVLTTVTELPENTSTLFEQTLTPSPSRPINGRHYQNLEVLERKSLASIDGASGIDSISGDGVSNTSSLDTPLKGGKGVGGTLDLSIDTPVKEHRTAYF